MLYGISKITSFLYLGGTFESPRDVDSLTARGVTHVLNCSEIEDPDFVKAAFDYLMAEPAKPDDGTPRGAAWFKAGLLFLGSGRVVYVHCHAGLNRSASMVYARLLQLGISRFAARAIIDLHRPMDLVGLRYSDEAEGL